VYHGLSLVDEIVRGLEERLKADGFSHISEAVGSKRGDWL
jgi:dihydroorotate dehydrogenase